MEAARGLGHSIIRLQEEGMSATLARHCIHQFELPRIMDDEHKPQVGARRHDQVSKDLEVVGRERHKHGNIISAGRCIQFFQRPIEDAVGAPATAQDAGWPSCKP